MTEYQKFLRHNSTVKAGLLGEYNQNDKYVISQDVAQELIKSNKLLTSYKEDEAKCEAQFGELKYDFKIKFFEDKAENKKYASLYVLEQYKHLGKKIELETFLVNFSEVNDNEYFTKLKEALKLNTKDESEGKDIKNSGEVIGKIVQAKKTKAKMLNKELMMANRKYIQDVLSVLKKAGPYGAKVQKLLKERIANIPIDKNDPNYWAKIKEILDEILEETKEDCPEEVRKWLELVNQNYVQLYMFKERNLKPVVQQKAKVGGKKFKAAAKKKKGDDGGDDDKKDSKKKKTESKNDKKNDNKNPLVQQPIKQPQKEEQKEDFGIFKTGDGYNFLNEYLNQTKDFNTAIAEASAKIAGEVFVDELGKVKNKKPLTEEYEVKHAPEITETVSMDELDKLIEQTNSDEHTL